MRLSGRVLATIASAANLPALLPPDVDPASGACARGFAKIAPSPGKGFGAFATLYMSPFYARVRQSPRSWRPGGPPRTSQMRVVRAGWQGAP